MDKLLFHSNAPWSPTGYGQQCALVTPHLNTHYDVGISAFYGLDGGRLRYAGMPVYPGLGVTYGNEVIEGHVRAHQADLVLSLMDVWVLDPKLWGKFPLVCWVPVDHDPVPPMVWKFFHDSGAIPMAMSRWGQEMLSDFDSLYVPHAIDTSVYAPRGRKESREMAGLPQDAFIVGIVAANKGNPSRKCFPEMLQAFAAFRQKRPNALLYLHTQVLPGDGIKLPMLIKSLGIPEDSLRLVDQYKYLFDPYPPSAMSHIYSCFDVLLNTSAGEGFGLPALEAQACGVPAIVSDFSAQKEVCGSGWKVQGIPVWTSQMSWQFQPDVGDIVEALDRCYTQPKKAREAFSEAARAHALTYDIEKVMSEHMLPALEEVQARIAMPEVALAA